MADAASKPALLALAVGGGFCLGFAGGRLTAPDPAPAVAPPPPGTSSATPPPPRTTTAATPPPAATMTGPPPPATEGPADPLAPRPVDLPGVLAAARRLREAPDDHHVAEAALAAAGELERRLGEDPEALARALEAFRGLGDAGDLETLGSVLGRIADPQVEAAALDVARRDVSIPRRVAAFEVLDALGAPPAREVALDVLGRDQDVELRRAALRAIPEPRGASVADAGPVVATLGRVLATDRDPELRRRAAVTLGRWHRAEADLQPLLDGLARDAAPEVRTGCAFGLEVAGRRSPAVTAALVAALAKPDEDPAVRETCWQALSTLGPLPPEAAAAWAAFQAGRVAAGEAGGREDDHGHGPLEDH